MAIWRLGRMVVIGCIALCGMVVPALAHPHVWIDAQVQPKFSASGLLTDLRVIWRMDELYSQTSVHGYDKNGDEHYSADELHPLITQAMDALQEWFYFTDIRQGGKRVAVKKPTVFQARMEGDRLVYDFTLPLVSSVSLTHDPLRVRLFDPSYYIEIDLAKKTPVLLDDMPKGCRSAILPARGLQETSLLSMGMGLSEQTYTSVESKPGTEGFGGPFAQTVKLSCES